GRLEVLVEDVADVVDEHLPVAATQPLQTGNVRRRQPSTEFADHPPVHLVAWFTWRWLSALPDQPVSDRPGVAGRPSGFERDPGLFVDLRLGHHGSAVISVRRCISPPLLPLPLQYLSVGNIGGRSGGDRG